MKRKREEISEKAKEELKEAMRKEKNIRVYKRYQAMYAYFNGMTLTKAAKMLGLNRRTLTPWYKRYKSEGLEGLKDRKIEGRPPRLSEEERNKLKEMILNRTPAEEGFGANYNWTAGMIGKYIKREYGLSYSIRGITGILKRMGLSYTRPTYVLAKADKQKQEEFKREFEEVKKNSWMKR
jgi:putative transposase